MCLHRMISVLCIILLIVPAFSFAEEPGTLLSEIDLQQQEQLFEMTRPLLELTVASSIRSGQTAYEFDAGDAMSSSFASSVLGLADLYDVHISDDAALWLGNNYAMAVQDLHLENSAQEDQYVGLLLLDLTPSPEGDQFAVTAEVYMAPKPYEELSDDDWNLLVWADMMAVLTLQSDEDAMNGWKVSSLHYLSAYFFDDTDETPVPEVSALNYYFNDHYGCSISYPSIFTEDLIQSTENGITSMLSDHSAALEIYCTSPDELSVEEAAQSVIHSHPEVVILSTELDDLFCVEYTQDEMTTRWFCTKTDKAVITVSLSWNPELHSEFSDLADKMMQSLIDVEDSLG